MKTVEEGHRQAHILEQAAPEMYEALKKAKLSLMRRDCCPEGLYEQIDLAIAKAEGGSKNVYLS